MKKIIGIVGGVGPYAGLEFNKKIFDATSVHTDQEHLEVVLISASEKIGDRTEYLLHPDRIPNPAEAIFSIIYRLYEAGAELITIPCNTAHSPPIWDVIIQKITEANIKVKIVHMLEETFYYLKNVEKDICKVGLLATRGTHQSKVYDLMAEKSGIELVVPDPETILSVHSSIYDSTFGIKAKSNPVTSKAVGILKTSAEKLISQGAQMIILGCTEIPLALKGVALSVPIIDPMDITANTLVRLAQGME